MNVIECDCAEWDGLTGEMVCVDMPICSLLIIVILRCGVRSDALDSDNNSHNSSNHNGNHNNKNNDNNSVGSKSNNNHIYNNGNDHNDHIVEGISCDTFIGH